MMHVFAVENIHFRIPGPTVHDGLTPPPAFPLVKLPHIELPHMMRWSPMGAAFTTTVLADKFQMAQLGNDAGIGVFHISIPPTNPLLPLTIATSICKNLFAAASVQVDKKPAAGFFPGLAPILVCCWPVPVPWFMLPIPCTVMLGFSLADFLAGWARCLIQMAVSLAFSCFNARIPGFDRFGQMAGNLGLRLGGRIAQVYAEQIAQELFKGIFGSLIGQGKIELPFQIGEYNPWTGEGKIGTREFNTRQGLPNISLGGGVDAAHQASAGPANGATSGLPSCR